MVASALPFWGRSIWVDYLPVDHPQERLPPAERCGKMTVGRRGDGRLRSDRPGTNRGDEQNVAIERWPCQVSRSTSWAAAD